MLPEQRKRRLYLDGNMWCAVDIGFRNLAQDPAGFGPTQEEAVAQLLQASPNKQSIDLSSFEVGGFCSRCQEWIVEGEVPDGCRDPDCPCIEPTQKRKAPVND